MLSLRGSQLLCSSAAQFDTHLFVSLPSIVRFRPLPPFVKPSVVDSGSCISSNKGETLLSGFK